MLKPGGSSLTWSRGGEPCGSISIVAQADGVRLLYWVTGSNGGRISVDELVPFRYTAARSGGRRQWLTCRGAGVVAVEYLAAVISDVGNAMG